MRVEVRQQRVGYVAQRGGVGGLGWTGVAADAQNLGILRLEIRIVAAERGDLVRSAACEREYVEREDDRLLAPEIAQGYAFHFLVRQCEVRGLLAYVNHCVYLS